LEPQVLEDRDRGADCGVVYPYVRHALSVVRQNVACLLCGLSFVLDDLLARSVFLPFPATLHLRASHWYHMSLRQGCDCQPQTARFVIWLRAEAGKTSDRINALFQQPL
jgi:hypothetical protein